MKWGIYRLFQRVKELREIGGVTPNRLSVEAECMKRTRVESDRWFEVLQETGTAQAAVMTLSPGQSTGGPDNYHAKSDQWLYVIEGEGRAVIDGEPARLTGGDLLCIEAGETHEIENTGDVPQRTLSLYVPPRSYE